MVQSLSNPELYELLEEKYQKFNVSDFIENDPVQIPHRFDTKEDIEISGFLTSTIAWGNRKSIISSCNKLMHIMGNSPHDFIVNHKSSDIKDLQFVHRTFNSEDLTYFFQALKEIYTTGNLEEYFSKNMGTGMKECISLFHCNFLSYNSPLRTAKHVANPAKGSAAKRINMFLRWMVRKDRNNVDFGIWKSISPSELYCPLDVHTGNVARHFDLIGRKANDWKSLEELMGHLRQFDPKDPVKYDFALFGMGVEDDF